VFRIVKKIETIERTKKMIEMQNAQGTSGNYGEFGVYARLVASSEGSAKASVTPGPTLDEDEYPEFEPAKVE
jgi:hypothetical protein